MADIVINTKVETPDLSPLQQINKELKAAKAAALNGDGQAAKRVAELKDKMEDLKDSTKSLQGSGIEKLKNSFGLLTEGFKNFDADKIKTSFTGIGSAMKAVPIFLIVEGIMKLIENFDKLKTSGGLLGKAFQAIGKIIDTLTTALQDFSDWIGLTDIEAEKMAEKQIENAKKVQDAVTARYDIEIRLAKAAGKSTEDIEKRKVQAVRESLLEQIKLKARAAVMDGELSAEELKNLDELRKALTENYVQEKELDLKTAKEKKDLKEQSYKDSKALKEKELADYRELEKQLSEARIAGAEIDKENNAMIAADVNADKAKFDQEAADAEYETLKAGLAKQKEEKDKAEAEDKLRAERKRQTEANYWSAASTLAETFFQLQIDAAEGNEDRQNELRKRAFNVDKALKASQATIDAIKSVNATLAQGGAFAVPLAVSIGVLGFANVAKILAAKFNPSSSGGGGSSSAPRLTTTGGNTPTPNQPTIPTNQPQQTTQFDDQGNKINSQPIVVKVSEINDVQRKVARVEQQSTF